MIEPVVATPTLDDIASTEQSDKSRKPEGDEGSEDFARVSATTLSKCLSPDDVQGRVQRYADHCTDYKDVKVSDTHMSGKKLLFKTLQWHLSSTAIGNLAGFGGRALQSKHKNQAASPGVRALRAYYLRKDETGIQLFDDICNDMLHHISKKSTALLRTYTRGDFRRIDALLTKRYGIIDNLWFLNVLHHHVSDGRWCALSFDGRTFSGHYLIADANRMETTSDLGGALAVGNSEVGSKSMTVKPSVFDWISGTGIIFGAYEGEALRRVHSGNINVTALEDDIQEHIDQQIPLFDSCIQNLEMLKDIAVTIDDAKKVIVDVGASKSITKDEKLRWLAGVEAEVKARGSEVGLSAYGLVNGLARVGKDAKEEGRDRELEMLAGTLATKGRHDADLQGAWKRILSRASSVDEDKVTKLFTPNVGK